MLLRLVANILHDILPHARPMNPIQQAPSAIISLPATRIMRRRAPRDPAHDDPRDDAVSGHRQCFLEGGEQGEEEVCKQMRTQEERGEIDGK